MGATQLRCGSQRDVAGKPHRNWKLFIPIAVDVVSRLAASVLNEKSNSVGKIVTPRLRHALLAENAGMLVLAKQWHSQIKDLAGTMDVNDWAATVRIGLREHDELDGQFPGDEDANGVANDEM
jgi:hypothetical protein